MGALNEQQKLTLYNAGFLRSEIAKFNAATTPDGEAFQDLAFNSKPFQAMIKHRKSAYDRERKSGLNDAQVRQKFQRALRVKNAPSPWDFLKVEYQPTHKTMDYLPRVNDLKNKITKRMPGYFTPEKKSKYKPVKRPLVRRGR